MSHKVNDELSEEFTKDIIETMADPYDVEPDQEDTYVESLKKMEEQGKEEQALKDINSNTRSQVQTILTNIK